MLEYINLPDTVTSIGNYAFQYCDMLEYVNLPNTVTSIGDYALDHCSTLKHINIPTNLTTIGSRAFRGCVEWEDDVIIPDTTTSLGEQVFHQCAKLSSITLGQGITSYATAPGGSGGETEGMFWGCYSLKSLTIPRPGGVGNFPFGASFGTRDYAGSDAVVQPVIIGGSEQNRSFHIPTSIESVTIRYGTKIEKGNFQGCHSIFTITIPETITEIGVNAFSSCLALRNIYFLGTMAQWSQITLGSNWNRNVPATVVHCSDGDVNI